MASTTYVQFLKGSLLVIFSFVLTVIILARGFQTREGGADGHVFRQLGPFSASLDVSLWQVGDQLTDPQELSPSGNSDVRIARRYAGGRNAYRRVGLSGECRGLAGYPLSILHGARAERLAA